MPCFQECYGGSWVVVWCDMSVEVPHILWCLSTDSPPPPAIQQTIMLLGHHCRGGATKDDGNLL